MPNDITQHLEAAYQRAVVLQQQAGQSATQDAILAQALRDLHFALEELKTSQEELITQKQTLINYQEQLKAERQRYQTLFNLAPEGYLVSDCKGIIQEANQAIARLLQRLPDAIAGKPIVVLLCERDRPRFYAILHRLMHLLSLETAIVHTWETQLLTRHGDAIDVEMTVSASFLPDSEDASLRWVIRDITERKQTQQALQQAAAAEAANHAKSTFLANMSHELRTPLNSIIGFSDLMRQSSTLPEKHQKSVQMIHRSGRTLLTLINGILDLSKIEAGKIGLDPKLTDLPQALQFITATINPGLTAKPIELHLSIAPSIPTHVIVDAQKLQQILLNLLSNAVKFTHQGHITLRVSQAAAPCNPSYRSSDGSEQSIVWLCFQVEDTGVGIAAENCDRVFDAFEQTSDGQAAKEGTGLGLAISRRIVQRMGGDISLQSVLGQGSTFQVVLPVGVEAHSARSSEEHYPCLEPVSGQPSYRMLIVDDQPTNRLLLVRILEGLNVQIRDVSSGEEAIVLWETWQPDVIWMDIRLPCIDGCGTTQHIRAAEQNAVPRRSPTLIIATTAQAQASERDCAIAAGCNDYLVKPFTQNDVYILLEKHLGLQFVDRNVIQSECHLTQLSTQNYPVSIDLSMMSEAWLSELYRAACICDDRSFQPLLQDLLPHQQHIAQHIQALADDFEFEQIIQIASTAFQIKNNALPIDE